MNRLLPLAAALLIAACGGSPAPPPQPPLAGARIGAPFALTDQDGRRFGDAALGGRYRIMYFGYTYCPDVCPVDVAAIAGGLKALAKRDAALAGRIVPVFVTVDPARDTPAVLKQFVSTFHPAMVGLTGSPEAIAALAKAYGAYFAKGAAAPGGGYLMDHSRQAYLMDPAGKPLALLPTEAGPDKVADEIRRWAR